MNIPEQVKNEAQWLIGQYGDSFNYLGNYEGQEAYIFEFPEDSSTGFPFVYLMKGTDVLEVTGPFAIDIIGSFIEDVDEFDVE